LTVEPLSPAAAASAERRFGHANTPGPVEAHDMIAALSAVPGATVYVSAILAPATAVQDASSPTNPKPSLAAFLIPR
jgi:hypothetical protein